jgi:DNA mismatch repair protein MutS2
LRVEEAKERFIDMLDLCLRDEVDQIRVIHGFGTGKVKAAIYEILETSRHVKNHRTEMGNAGVTVVYL